MPGRVLGWGARSHISLCEASVHLLSNPDLRTYLTPRTYILGHLCLIPDSDWKDHSKKVLAAGNPSHFINPQRMGFAIKDIPLEFSEIIKRIPGKNIEEKHKKAGSNWWRAKQFYELAVSEGKSGNSEKMIHSLGLMGHFIGDNGNTFHVVDDYDGVETGQAGIHDYYETLVPGLWGPGFVDDIVKEAQSLAAEKPAFLKADNFLMAMKELALLSARDEEFILKSDPLIKKSRSNKDAIRKEPDQIFAQWRPVILRSLARSALLQAKFMDRAYEIAGQPKLGKEHLAFPFRVPFVRPDYLD